MKVTDKHLSQPCHGGNMSLSVSCEFRSIAISKFHQLNKKRPQEIALMKTWQKSEETG